MKHYECIEHSNHKIHLVNGKISLIQSLVTGKFVKHSLFKSFIERLNELRSLLALLSCVMFNIISLSYFFWSN